MAREVEMCVEAFYGSEGTCLFKPLPLVVGWEGGHNWGGDEVLHRNISEKVF